MDTKPKEIPPLESALACITNAVKRFDNYMNQYKHGLPEEHFRTWSLAHSMNCDCVEAIVRFKQHEDLEKSKPHGPSMPLPPLNLEQAKQKHLERCMEPFPVFQKPDPGLAELEKNLSSVQVKPIQISDGHGTTSRRFLRDFKTPAEVAMHEAICAVSNLGHSAELVDVVKILTKARGKISDYIDRKLTESKETQPL